jgi:hypothetical protein
MLPILAGLGIGLLGGGISSAIGASKSSKNLQQGAERAADITKQYTKQAVGYQQPAYDQGMQSLSDLSRGINSGQYNMQQMRYSAPNAPKFTNYGQFTGQYNSQQAPIQQSLPKWNQQYQSPGFNFQSDPGYQFRLQEGMNAIQGSAAARGNALSGSTLKALQKYGQNLASDEMQNAYNRYQDQRNFGYGQYRDTRGDYEADRALAYQQGRDVRGDYEADRGFGYGQYRDTRGDYEADRAYNTAQQAENYGRYHDQRDFGYGTATDAYNRQRQELSDQYNRQASLANLGIGSAGNLSNIYSSAGGQLADITTGAASAKAAGTAGMYNALGNTIQGLGYLPLLGSMGGQK